MFESLQVLKGEQSETCVRDESSQVMGNARSKRWRLAPPSTGPIGTTAEHREATADKGEYPDQHADDNRV